MNACWIPLLLLLAAGGSSAAGLEPVSARSQSGQFIVRGIPMGAPVSGYSTSKVQYLRLDPTLTAVSLERVRQGILAELGLKDTWLGLIAVSTRPLQDDDSTIEVNSVRYKDGWGYRVEMPERVDKDAFIRTAVKVVLLEIANRTALTREAELPPWLAEGLAAELQSTVLSTLALEPETLTSRRDVRHDPLQTAREVLRRRPALKFDELNMPSAEMLSAQGIEVFRACAQIYVHELLRLRTGRDCLRELLTRLPENLNWQTTFLQAFRGYFEKLIDADKWYALTLANIAGRDPMSRWPLDTSWKQLDDILTTRVQVRLNAGELPIDTSATLQRLVTEWEKDRQQPVLAQKVNHLQALRSRVAPELSELVDAYIEVLQAHLEGRSIKLPALPTTSPAEKTRLSRRVRNVVQHLDVLEARRETLRPQNSPAGRVDTPLPR